MIRIAIQSKGRLSDASIEFLRSRGLKFEPNGRSLVTPCANRDVEILWLRSGDIPEYVNRGVADFGIAGANVLAEKGMELEGAEKMDFGFCKLVIAVPGDSGIHSVRDLEGERIATSYPIILSRYLQAQGIRAAIIPLRGSVEIAPRLNLADAICDLVQTGKTLSDNHLKPLVTILESQAILIKNQYVIPAKAGIFSELFPNQIPTSVGMTQKL